jgi:hypothetical protein
MRLPRVRFTIRGMMVAVAGSSVALAYLGAGSTKLGCGETSVRQTFRVMDDRDGRRIDGARFELIPDYSAPPTAYNDRVRRFRESDLPGAETGTQLE